MEENANKIKLTFDPDEPVEKDGGGDTIIEINIIEDEKDGGEANDSVSYDREDGEEADSENSEDNPAPYENAEPEPQVSFEESLSMLTRENIGAGDKKIMKLKKYGPVQIAVVALCTAVCVVSTSLLAQNIYGKYKGSRIYSEVVDIMNGNKNSYVSLLAGEVPSPETPTLGDIIASGVHMNTTSVPVKDMMKMIAGLESLSDINPDTFAWIRITGIDIDYPVMQSDDNDYYLNHAYTGDNIPNGSIFADYRCSGQIMTNYNTVIYGHNMTDGSMFNGIRHFVNDENVFRDARIYVYTFYGVFVYRAFSAYETTYDSGYIDTYFETPGDFGAFLEEVAGRSAFQMSDDIELREDRGILTLSTCTNGYQNARYAVHAALVDYAFK